MGFRADRQRDVSDKCGVAIFGQFRVHSGICGPDDLWVLVPHGYLRRIRLAAVWIWIGLVAVRQRWMGFRSGIRLDVHRSAAVGLAAVSLWRMGVRARNRLGVVVDQVLDTVENARAGSSGVAVLRERVTELLDFEGLLQAAGDLA